MTSSSIVSAEAVTKTTAPQLSKADLPELEKELERIRTRLRFLLAAYFQPSGENSFRMKAVPRVVADEVKREIADLQETGLAVESLIARLKP